MDEGLHGQATAVAAAERFMQTSQRQSDRSHQEPQGSTGPELAGDFESPEGVAALAELDATVPGSASSQAAGRVTDAGHVIEPVDGKENPAAFDDWLAGQIQELLDAAPAEGVGEPPAEAAAAKAGPHHAELAGAFKGHDGAIASVPAPADPLRVEMDELDDTLAQAEAVTAQLGELADAMGGVRAEPAAGFVRVGPADLTAGSGGAAASTHKQDLTTDSPAPQSPADAAMEADLMSFEELLNAESEAMAREQASGDGAGLDDGVPGAAASRLVETASADQSAGGSEAGAAPPGEISQLDEFLAGQADDAVAGDFETVHDVMAAQQAATASRGGVSVEQSAAAGAVPGQGGEPDASSKRPGADAPASGAVAGQVASEPAQARRLDGMTPAAPPPVAQPSMAAPVGAAAEQERQPGRRPLVSRLAAMMAKSARAAGGGTLAAARLTCAALNRPLNRLSESHRNLLGYAGVVSLINGALLLLARAFNLLG